MAEPLISLPRTLHSVFYAYTITIGGTEIGSFEKFGQRSTRSVERIREVMYSQGARVKDMVWGGTDITLELTRVELYEKSLLSALGNTAAGLQGLEYFNFKFQINEVRKDPSAGGKTRTISFMNCIPSDFSKDIDTGTARVMETMTVQVGYVMASEK